jgi:hypothetical protein
MDDKSFEVPATWGPNRCLFTTRQEILIALQVIVWSALAAFFFLWLRSEDVSARVRLLESGLMQAQDDIAELRYGHI